MAGQLPRPAVPLREGADGEHGPEEDAGAEDAGVREEAARRPPAQRGDPEAQDQDRELCVRHREVQTATRRGGVNR